MVWLIRPLLTMRLNNPGVKDSSHDAYILQAYMTDAHCFNSHFLGKDS